MQFNFLEIRSFGDKINAVFQVVKLHFKPLVKKMVLYSGAFFLLAGAGYSLGYGSFMSDIISDPTSEEIPAFTWLNIAGLVSYIVGSLLGTWVLMTVVYRYFFLVVKEGQVTKEMFQQGFFKHLLKVFLAFLILMLLIFIPIVLLIGIGALFTTSIGVAGIFITLLLMLVAFIYFAYIFIKLSPYIFATIFEDIDVITGLKRSFYLTKGRFWSVLGFLLVLGIIQSVMSYVFMVPLYVSSFLPSVLANGDSLPFWATFIGSLFAGLSFIGYGMVTSLTHIATIIEYFNLRERKEGIGLAQKITEIESRFDEL